MMGWEDRDKMAVNIDKNRQFLNVVRTNDSFLPHPGVITIDVSSVTETRRRPEEKAYFRSARVTIRPSFRQN